MDLNSFSATQDITLEVKNPRDGSQLCDDDGTPVVITFFNVDTKEFIAARNALMNAQRKNAARGNIPTVQQDLENGIKFLVGVTKGWTRMPAFGQKLDFNAKNAEKVYGTIHWLRAQVDECLAQASKRENFTPEESPQS